MSAPQQITVELTRAQVEEMIRAYVNAKFGLYATPLHGVHLTVHPNKFVVSIINPPSPIPGGLNGRH